MTRSSPHSHLCTEHGNLFVLLQTYGVGGFMYSKHLCLKGPSLYLHKSLFSGGVSMAEGTLSKS